MKKLLKFLKRVYSNFWVQIVFWLACAAIIFWLSGAFASERGAWAEILEIVTSPDVLSIFLAAALSLIVAKLVLRGKRVLEESLKIEDDHHKIISQYHGHSLRELSGTENIYDATGAFMYLECVPPRRRKPANMVKDRYSAEHKRREKEISDYMDGRLYLSSVCVYANVKGDAVLRFHDSTQRSELPAFVRENALQLLEAHHTSSVHNSVTVRLKDLRFRDGVLDVYTERSQYFHMLVTNRCMDYRLNGNVSVREVYEFNNTVSPLSETMLGNQIGINGLIFTRDGYILVEKRGRKKTTWKDKFAQPISLAMKESDLLLDADGTISDDPAVAERNFKKIILSTLAKNFGLGEEDLLPFSVAENFLGVARDLLEGGKPNFYFYVVADYTAEQLVARLQEKAKRASEGRGEKGEALPSLGKDKLDSAFYLVRYRDVQINFGYVMKMRARTAKRIRRKFRPRVSAAAQAFEGFGYRLTYHWDGTIDKECGEALLACLSFVGVCRERLQRDVRF